MSDLSTTEVGMIVLAGLYGVKEFLVPVVKGSFSRNLQAKDEHDKETKKKLEEHDAKLTELKTLAELKPKVEHHEQILNELKLAQSTVQATLASQLGAIDGRLTALDTRIEKQGLAHDQRLKEGLAEVTTELNRKLASTLNSELEHTVREVLREELKLTRRKRS